MDFKNQIPKIKAFASNVLPGVFLIGYNVGTGSVTTMSKAGANFGLDLLWVVLTSCLTTYYLITLFSRYTMATGKTIILGIKHHIHPLLAIGLIIALSIIIVTALIGLLNILAQVLSVWSYSILSIPISKLWWAIIIGLISYVFLWKGKYQLFEKVLAVLVSIMGGAFILTASINFPSIYEIIEGFIPKIPQIATGSDNSPSIIFAGMIGTTVSVFAFIIRSQIVKEKGWKMSDNGIQKRDALVSASLMFIISASILITAATTLHVNGLKMNSVVEMIPLLEPIAGKAALSIFVVGILAAGLSSHLPNLLVIPWLIIDYKGTIRNTQTYQNRILLFLLTLLSIIGVAFDVKPVFVMMLSQASLAIVLPFTLAAIFYLTNKAEFMHDHKNKWYDKLILCLIMIFSIYTSLLGIIGLKSDLLSILS